MLRVSLSTTVSLLVLAIGVGACDGSSPAGGSGAGEPRDADAPLWHPWGERRARIMDAALPLVENARWDRPTERRVMLGVSTTGDAWLQGDGLPAGTADAENREAAVERLRSVLDEQCSDPGLRAAHGSCRLPLMVHAHGSTPWNRARDLLAAALGPGRRFTRLYWTVEHPATPRLLRQEASIGDLPASDAPGRIELSGRWTEEHRRNSELTVRIGSAAWTSTQTRDLPEPRPASLPPASTLRRHLSGGTVALRVAEPADAVTWGNVVVLLDRLLSAGFRRVALPDLGIRLDLAEPEDLSRDPLVHEDDPVLTTGVALLAALAALLAIVLTLAPLWGLGRPARRRPRPSSTA